MKFVTVKIHEDTYERLKELVLKVSREGWKSVGLDWEVAPTLGNVVAAGLLALDNKKRR